MKYSWPWTAGRTVFLAFRGVRYPGGADIEVAWKEVPIPQRAVYRAKGEEHPVATTLRVERVRVEKDPQAPLTGLLHVLRRDVSAGYLASQLEDYRRRRFDARYEKLWRFKQGDLRGPYPLRLPHPLNDGAVLVAGALELLLEGFQVPLSFGPLPEPLLVDSDTPKGTEGYPKVLEGDTVLQLDEFGVPVLFHEDGKRKRAPMDAAEFFNMILDGATVETWVAIGLLAIQRA